MTAVSAAIFPIGWGPVTKEVIVDDSFARFPQVTGMNLEGKKFHLPEDFAAEKNIVIVAFKRKQQADINTWLYALSDFVLSRDDLEMYELPVLKKFNFLMRFNINNGMRYGIDSKDARNKTVTVYLEKEDFRKSLNIPHEDSIYIFLIDREANVIWRSSGSASDAKISELKAII